MLFRTTDSRIETLEKKLSALEKQTGEILRHIDESFVTITDAMTSIEKDHAALRKERDALLEKQRLLRATVPAKDTAMAPVKRTVKEKVTDNVAFFREVAREGLAPPGPSLYGLLRLVEQEKDIGVAAAARALGVHDVQIETWASQLQKEGLVAVVKRKDKTYLQKA